MFSFGRRYLVLWLPYWGAERWLRTQAGTGTASGNPPPVGLTASAQGGIHVVAVNDRAVACGIRAGMTLADARALLPEITVAPADPAGDLAALDALADWCGRYAPWTATDGADAVRVDITGSAHLMGGEAALLADLNRRLSAAGCTVRAAIADTPGAAWAVARHGPGGVVPAGGVDQALASLPVAGLRLDEGRVTALSRVGIRTIGALAGLPRGPLARRFGAETLRRLDQALGRLAEPISPRRPAPSFRVRLTFAEPIARREDVAAAAERLLTALAAELSAAGQGLRRLDLVAFRVDGDCRRIGIGTAAPSRAPRHLMRLLDEHLDRIDPGFGIEVILLEAHGVQAMDPAQAGAGDALEALVDRLRNHLGPQQVTVLRPVDSHVPERAVAICPAEHPLFADAVWPERGDRPIALLPAPERVEAGEGEVAAEAPPDWFIWRRVVRTIAQARGPERIAPEWWRPASRMRTRDYWHLTDTAGRRYWLFRDPSGWYLQGLFA